MMKKIISVLFALLLCLQLPSSLATAEESQRLQIITTIFAPYDFARQIVGGTYEENSMEYLRLDLTSLRVLEVRGAETVMQ